ncbi:hypothetical protein RB13016 [Rhodopirellula baltica SH 1]|uniref:Uncharacterized protein n=1 Tax=Rhodopirellula baltica (strain DSM 10527 / NCIMB 13988 / SH1) TaxID=243090 RepID=Q7UHS3_RHOBA|nr:hypothetical protein RB13016 [Rhodopirellula baltica SH 1]
MDQFERTLPASEPTKRHQTTQNQQRVSQFDVHKNCLAGTPLTIRNRPASHLGFIALRFARLDTSGQAGCQLC